MNKNSEKKDSSRKMNRERADGVAGHQDPLWENRFYAIGNIALQLMLQPSPDALAIS